MLQEVTPNQNQNQTDSIQKSQELTTQEKLELVRKKILQSTSGFDFTVGNVKYDCIPISRSEIFAIESFITKKYDLKSNPSFDKTKGLYQQLSNTDFEVGYELAKILLVKVITKIDDLSVKDIFEFQGSPFVDYKAGLDKYLDSKDIPIFDILNEYFNKYTSSNLEVKETIKNS